MMVLGGAVFVERKTTLDCLLWITAGRYTSYTQMCVNVDTSTD